ncbi:unnamed protein product, partial [Brachionus calyciflorus]
QLRPIKSKSAIEVATSLFDIFSIFGVPYILQSDNGREFRNQIVNALKSMWPEMSIVHGRARHPQSQGSVERANSDVKKMLATWMRENKSTKWSIGVKFVQLRKNHTLHTANKCSPYKATFGVETPLGLTSTVVPVELWSPKTPKELFDAVGCTYDDTFPDDDNESENSLVPPNLECRIVDIDFNTNLHELVCEAGVLNTLFARNCFDLMESSTILNFSFKLDTTVSVRQAVGLISLGVGQGMIKCN